MSRSVNTKRNIIWGLFQKILSVLLPFFVRTALIYSLGVEYVGLNSLFVSILSVLSLAELGFASAVAYSMYKPIAEDDKVAVLQLLHFFRNVYRVIGVSILVAGLIAMPFLDYLVEGAKPDDVNLQIAFGVYLLNTVISYLACGYRQTLLDAHQRNDVVSKVGTAMCAVVNILQICLLMLVPSYYLFIAVLPLFTVVQNIVISQLSNRLFPEYCARNFKGKSLDKVTRKAIGKRVMGIMVYRTCQTTRDACDSIFISFFLGLTAVACYSNYFLIVSSLLAILEVICSSMTASVGNSIASESPQKNFKDMRLLMFLYSVVATILLACLLCLYQLFMILWLGPDLLLPDSIVILLCVYYYVRVVGDIRSVYVDAAGLWWHLKGRSIIEAVMNIVLNFILIQHIGVAGAVLATIISMLLVNYLWGSEVVFSRYFKNGKLHVFFADNGVYALVAILACAASYAVCATFGDIGWIWFVVKGLVAICVSSVVILLLFCRTERFKEAKAFIINNVIS